MDYFEGKKVVIPGGSGFFGSFLVPQLRQRGTTVFVPKHDDGWDFTLQEDCRRLYKKDAFDMVINCAAFQGGIGFHIGKQADLYHQNLLMGTFLLKEAQAAGIPKFVNIVAGCSYPGYLEKGELNEEDYWDGWLHDSIFSYGFARKATVVQGLALKKQLDYNSIHLIMANMYGPGEHFHPQQSKALAGLLKKVYEAKKNGQPNVEIWGSGKPVRDWLYVKDAADLVLKAAALYNEVEPMNIATGIGISINDLAEIIKKVVGYQGNFIHNTEKSDGAMKKIFGIEKMVKKIGQPKLTPLETGIMETLQWFEQNYEYAINH